MVPDPQPLIRTLSALQIAQRYLHPGTIARLASRLDAYVEPLESLQTRVEAGAPLALSAELALKALHSFRDAAASMDAMMLAYRALRYVPYALEHLYPYVSESEAVNAFFSLPGEVAPQPVSPMPDSGVIHLDNERGSKGGCSVFVPENYDPTRAYPLVVALHGGSGHGRGFLWTWVREARSRELIVISATSIGQTWGLMEPDADTHNLERMVALANSRWHIDESRQLLTGMSDGGTFTFLTGLRSSSVFTHLAPIAASFHPMMLEMIPDVSVSGRQIYLTHGAHDWMFPIDVARVAELTLRTAGAALEYREIDDLAHTYPREENVRITAWLKGDELPEPAND